MMTGMKLEAPHSEDGDGFHLNKCAAYESVSTPHERNWWSRKGQQIFTPFMVIDIAIINNNIIADGIHSCINLHVYSRDFECSYIIKL